MVRPRLEILTIMIFDKLTTASRKPEPEPNPEPEAKTSPPAELYTPKTTPEQRNRISAVIKNLDPSIGYYGLDLVLEDLRNAEAALGEKW